MTLDLDLSSTSVNLPNELRPATIPASVGSTDIGKTLLVPVDSGIRSISLDDLTIARFVPSPPKETIVLQPASRKQRSPSSVSLESFLMGASKIWTLARSFMCSRASEAILKGSLITKISVTPTESAPAAIRATMSLLAS